MRNICYKWCAVPECENTTIKTPDKMFVCVPKKANLRKKWMQLARRFHEGIMINSVVYFCEDHFDMEKDMSNYLKYKMGYSQRILMKKGALPSKFHCQQDRKTCDTELPSSDYECEDAPSTAEDESMCEVIIDDIDVPCQVLDNKELLSSRLISEVEDMINSSIYVSQNDESCGDLNTVSTDLDAPASLTVCRVCLAMDVKMYHISQHDLNALYGRVTGVEIKIEDKLPQMLCWECVARLSAANNFIEKALKTQWILLNNVNDDNVLTIGDIKSIDKVNNNIESTLRSNFITNEPDLHIIEETDTDSVIDSRKVRRKKIAKQETTDNEVYCIDDDTDEETLSVKSDDLETDVIEYSDVNIEMCNETDEVYSERTESVNFDDFIKEENGDDFEVTVKQEEMSFEEETDKSSDVCEVVKRKKRSSGSVIK